MSWMRTKNSFAILGSMMWLSHDGDARALLAFCAIVCSCPSLLLDLCGSDLENGDYLALSVLETGSMTTSSVSDLWT